MPGEATPLPETHAGEGLTDLQLNGYAGLDFNARPEDLTPEAMHEVRRRLARRGVARALPTLITDDTERMIARAARYAELVATDEDLAAAFPALHVEGPFVSPTDGPRGAHPKCWCKLPSGAPDFFDRVRDAAGGRVAIMTLAPELGGAVELIGRGAAAGVCMAIGHTAAPADVLDAAVAGGATLSSHLGNGSHQTLGRLDNYIQHQLADDRLHASFIADGHHMPLTTLKNFVRAKTPARSVLVTDAIAAAEMPPGEYELAGQRVVVNEDGRAAKPGEANLAGSTLTLDRAVVNAVRAGAATFAEAWAMASSIPSGLVNLPPAPPVTVRITPEGFEAD